mmetsp:Transcript_10214/g.14447  ORF Transcript_10214/g.14447 Transcript_10214/m.14447 type:complete len:862 (+) Transcript_10214:24-2609(+)
MIALRGILKKEDEKWKWSGMWAFGSLPVEASLEPVSGSGRRAKNPVARPFVYTWDQAKDPSDVPVPSINAGEDTDEDETMKSKDETTSQQESGGGSNTTDGDANKTQGRNAMGDTMNTKNPEESTDSTSQPKTTDSSQGTETKEGKDVKVKDTQDENNKNLNKKEIMSDRDDNTKKEESKSDNTSKTEPMDIEKDVKKTNVDTPKEDKASDERDKKSKESSAKGDLQNAVKDNKEEGTNEITKTSKEPGPDELSTSESKKLAKNLVTYGTVSLGEPTYTSASTKHPDKCAPDGAWKGYFENVSKRKDRVSSRVAEKFCLFFNATPAKDARVQFQDEDAQSDAKNEKNSASEQSEGMLSPGHIHVRGMGTNQFGTFEILGSFNLETEILECQRMYVVTVDSTSRTRSPSRTSRSDASSTPRAYNTRKRPKMSWQKRSSINDDEYDDASSRRSGGSSVKKRFRPSSSPSNLTDAKSPMPSITISNPAPTPKPSSNLPASSSSSKRPSPRTGSVPKKTSRSSSGSKGGSSSSSSTTQALKLPPAGDPREARWRASHFLYYQRNDPSADAESGGGTKLSHNSAASYVVYEGEMLHGGCLRDGRGVCLYSNGTLYEGEWKRNKEHGVGVLMSADRKRTIYSGEWERGRMHGRGAYHYNDDVLFRRRPDDKNAVSRYEGEFKENARHGVGRYVLPDGSVYDGEWRDNVPCGRGTFHWVDGSTYVGLWKDGKRNGQGTLQTSDGFTYDGAWVRNAMEGRGIATYPNGQRYEGLWMGGRREGRGTIHFTNGAVYEGRFRDDCMEGQGTMKMSKNVTVPRSDSTLSDSAHEATSEKKADAEDKDDWMIPIHFQSDMGHIHQKAGFTVGGE